MTGDHEPGLLLSILIPAYNEAETIGSVLDQLISLNVPGAKKEILVVDDGSADSTPDVVRSRQARCPEVRLLSHGTNRGKGWAIRTGIEASRGDILVIQDADNELRVEDIPGMLEALRAGSCPVIYGSRFSSGVRPRNMPKLNYLANLFLTTAANWLYGLRLTDEATCYKMFRTDVLKSIPLNCRRFEFCPEITAKLARHRIPIREVPVSYFPRNSSEGKKIRWYDGLDALWTLLRYRLWR